MYTYLFFFLAVNALALARMLRFPNFRFGMVAQRKQLGQKMALL